VKSSPDVRNQIKEDELGGVFGTYGRHEECTQNFNGENVKKEIASKT